MGKKRSFSRRHPGVKSNVGDPTPHGANNSGGGVSAYTESTAPLASQDAIKKDNRSQLERRV